MISIITSVHNQVGMNRLFYETLKQKSSLPFELIVIDNNSTDGSREFFRAHADVVIENERNYSYPYCQNQGMQKARYPYLAFFNNDILVSEAWDKKVIALMEEKGIDVVSFATNDHLENTQIQRKLNNRWKRIKYPLIVLFGTGYTNLKVMARLMYGNFERFCRQRNEKFGQQTKEGFSGSAILFKKTVLEKVGNWDERIQGADFDLFCRTKARSISHGDIRPIQIALGIYFHHYQRLTLKARYEPFADKDNLISFNQKWGEQAKTLLADIH
jgi:GT2 family glycosyltransferase